VIDVDDFDKEELALAEGRSADRAVMKNGREGFILPRPFCS
jgi:hypothetical protein